MKVFITGVSSGIGNAVAEAYLKTGAQVYGVSRRVPNAFPNSPHLAFKSLDLQKTELIRPALVELLACAGGLDLVILNAGIAGKVGDVNETTVSEFKQVMEVNVWANKVILDSLFDICGPIHQVVAITSEAGLGAYRGTPAYCISKCALNMLIALYAQEQRKTHFSAVAPPLIKTTMHEEVIKSPLDERFPTIEALRNTYGQMPCPKIAAEELIEGFAQVLSRRSGTFNYSTEFGSSAFLGRLSKRKKTVIGFFRKTLGLRSVIQPGKRLK